MDKLQNVFQKKIKHPIKIITNDYPFTKLLPTKKFNKIYLYYINNKNCKRNFPYVN